MTGDGGLPEPVHRVGHRVERVDALEWFRGGRHRIDAAGPDSFTRGTIRYHGESPAQLFCDQVADGDGRLYFFEFVHARDRRLREHRRLLVVAEDGQRTGIESHPAAQCHQQCGSDCTGLGGDDADPAEVDVEVEWAEHVPPRPVQFDAAG